MSEDDATGRRIRELRSWRGLSLRAAAELAGITYGYLAKIERGDVPVNNRRVLEALAEALRVSPAELTARPWAPTDPAMSVAHSSLLEIEAVLTEWWPGEKPDDLQTRPWPMVEAEQRRLADHLRPTSDYAGQGEVLPRLIRDLLSYAVVGDHRAEALRGLISAYHAAGNLAGRLGARHLAYVAAERVTQAAELLDEPEWMGVAAWTRAQFVSSISRSRQYKLAVAATDLPGSRLESRGMGHLTAALAAAIQGQRSTADAHLAEAALVAEALGLDNSTWGAGSMNFGRANVGIWRMSIAADSAEHGQVAMVAKQTPWQAAPISRQGSFWIDYGRCLLAARSTRDDGMAALLKAEELTPQQVHTNLFVREAVADLVRKAKREAGGRELRGLAWRMGVAPNG